MTPALALLVTEGFSTENGHVRAAAGTVAAPVRQSAGAPRWRRKLLVGQLLAGLAAKFAGLGLVAKAGMGLTLVAASTTAAGAVGVLPDPAQHAVATVVEAATPFTFPDSSRAPEPKVGDKVNPGATVSTDATGTSDGAAGVDGKVVSDAARNRADDPTGTPAGGGVGANTGAKGLDRANETPASGHAPMSVPSGKGPSAVPGSQAGNGLGNANSTPAAGKAPSGAPPVATSTPADAAGARAPGLDTAGTTPAAGRVPARP